MSKRVRDSISAVKIVPDLLMTVIDREASHLDRDQVHGIHNHLIRRFLAASEMIYEGGLPDGRRIHAVAAVRRSLQAAEEIVFLLLPKGDQREVTDADCTEFFARISWARELIEGGSRSVYVQVVNLGRGQKYIPGRLYQMREDGTRQEVI